MATMSEQDWYASLATMYGSAAALITETAEPPARVLLVKPNYRDGWSLPGGILEDGEPPHGGCRREVHEELGLDLPIDQLLAVSWLGAEGLRPRPILSFVFDGGVLADPESIRLQKEELDDWTFVAPADFGDYLPPMLVARIRAAAAARVSGVPAYLAIDPRSGLFYEPVKPPVQP